MRDLFTVISDILNKRCTIIYNNVNLKTKYVHTYSVVQYNFILVKIDIIHILIVCAVRSVTLTFFFLY